MTKNLNFKTIAMATVLSITQLSPAFAVSNYPCNDMRAIRDAIPAKQTELLDYKSEMVLQTSRANQITNLIEYPDTPTESRALVQGSIDELLTSRSNLNKLYNKLTILKNGINTDLDAYCGGA